MRSAWYGIAVLAVSAAVSLPVMALTDKQITEKLNIVPAFAIVNKQGSPLVGRIKTDKEEVGVVPIFTDGDLAQKNFDQFKKSAPADVVTSYQIIPISLGEAFEAARKERQNKDSKVQYLFRPPIEATQSALELAQKTDPKLKDFPGIPVFFLGKAGQPTITINRGSEKYLPFYFSQKDLKVQWEQIKKDKPDLVGKADIQVAVLENVLNLMLDSKNEQSSQNITFVPDSEALKFVETIQKNLPAGFANKSGALTPTPAAKP